METTWVVKVGSVRIEAPPDLARLIGYEGPYGDDADRLATWRLYRTSGPDAVAQALSEGLVGEAALLRAVAIVAERREAEARASRLHATAEIEAQAASRRLEAARIDLEAARVRAEAGV